MTTLYFQKIRGQFEEYLLIFDDYTKPLLRLDKHQIEQLNKEWKQKLEDLK